MDRPGSSPKSPAEVANEAIGGNLSAGMQVTPNVRLVEKLSEGAMGSVWAAEHLTLNTKVAVKFVSEALDPNDAEVLERFKREASTAAQIKSPHVVQTFDQGVMNDGTHYIVLEYLEGESLGERLERRGQVSLRDTGLIVMQVGRALSGAHQQGIVHRDIKPDNIFLTTEGDEALFCKVLDFGIAKHTRQAHMRGPTEQGELVGTPEFMSPEQLMGSSEVDYRADLWALAVVAYCCVTGKLPFLGANVGELCVNILNAEFEPPSRTNPAISEAVDAWFLRALDKSANHRFASAKEMALSFVRVVTRHSSDADLDVDSGQFLLPPDIWETSSPELSADGSPPSSPAVPSQCAGETAPAALSVVGGGAADGAPTKRTLPRSGIAAVAAGTGLALGVVLATLLYTADDDSAPSPDAGHAATGMVGAGLADSATTPAGAEHASAQSTASSIAAGSTSPSASAVAPVHGPWRGRPGKRSSTGSKTDRKALGF